jgi:hypothetical protein
LAGQKRGQIAVISVCLGIALIGFFILATFMSVGIAIDDAKQTAGHPAAMTTSDAAVGLPLAGLCTILWATGAVGPLLVRHRRPRAFLESPFVLFLRRFSTFSDRTHHRSSNKAGESRCARRISDAYA